MSYEEFKHGLTFRCILAIILAVVVFLPVSIYVNLVGGPSIAGAATYLLIILFSEFTIGRTPLSKQELYIIYATVGMAAGFISPYYWLPYYSWFVKSPLIRDISLHGIPLLELIPDWFAPPLTSSAHTLRTLLHPDWIPALIIRTIFAILSFMTTISLAIIFSYLYIELEPLPFPFVQISASMIETLVERDPRRMQYFLLPLAIGLISSGVIYGSFLLGVPVLPLPWVDFTSLIESYLPGAILGLATDPMTFVGGFILPPYVTASLLIGSLGCYFFANTLFLTTFRIFPGWVRDFQYGMTIASLQLRSFVHIWYQILLGFQIGLALSYIIIYYRSISRSLGALKLITYQKRTTIYPSLWIVLSIFLVSTVGSAILYWYYVPDYPKLIPLIVSPLYSFFITLVGARAIGEVGSAPTLLIPWRLITYFSGYEGFSGWFLSPVMVGGGGGMVAQTKLAYLTRTYPLDYYKAQAIAFILALIGNLFFMDFFWRLAPMPSSAYPNLMVSWPYNVPKDLMFITRTINMKLEYLFAAIFFSMGIGFAEKGLFRIGIPFSSAAFVTGTFILPPYTIMQFCGSLVSEYVFSRIMGRERWHSIRGTVIAGYFAGSSIAVGIGVALTLLSKATWFWPW